MEITNKLVETIFSSKSVLILSHIGPDGDTLGSMLGLKNMLAQIPSIEKLDTVIVGKFPDIYKFLPGMEDVEKHDSKNLYKSYNLVISVDCASIDRLEIRLIY